MKRNPENVRQHFPKMEFLPRNAIQFFPGLKNRVEAQKIGWLRHPLNIVLHVKEDSDGTEILVSEDICKGCSRDFRQRFWVFG